MMLTYTAIIGRQLLPPQHHILPHKAQKTPKPRALPHNSPATRTVPVYQTYTQNPNPKKSIPPTTYLALKPPRSKTKPKKPFPNDTNHGERTPGSASFNNDIETSFS